MLLLLPLLPHATCTSLHGNQTDRIALLDLKLSCSDPYGSLASWNASSNFCFWKGVSCSRKHPQRVTQLDLTDQRLSGYISPSLGNLTHLRTLRLSNNSFTGEVPDSLGQLRRLEVISLSNNSLQGWIPDEISNCSNLQILSLRSNLLKGRIPYTIGSLSKLDILNLSENNLTGSIPRSIGNMTSLNVLSLSENYLQGSIPEELGLLLDVSYLGLGANFLSGRTPPTLFNLSCAIYLGLELNHLDKAVLPSDFGSHLPKLQHLGLDSNNFEGPIPASIANASSLIDIGLSSNYFSGTVPSSLGRLHDLTFLNLQSNSLEASDRESWEFMDSLANCSKLQIVALALNNLRGDVPSSIGNLSSQLQILYLGTNQLSGVFPSGIANLQNLIALSLENNQYVGAIPEWVGKLGNLQVLYMEGNRFTGQIPLSIGNLSQLLHLYLQDNKIEGFLSPSLGNMTNLQRLNITNNSLQGSVPAEIFSLPSLISCQLSFNKLDGMLPPEVGKAKQLMELELSSNQLSGVIPNALGNCRGLETIELAQNSLIGEIPVSLGNLGSLKRLNLSHNNLSGSIPKSLGGLKLLNQIDISYNHLVCEIPTKGVFLNASGTVLKGNSGLCGGVAELHIPPCSVPSSDSFRRRRSLRVKVIAAVMITVISVLAILIILSFLYREKKVKQASLVLPSFGAKFPRVTYKDLAEATDQFSSSNLIGRGRYGSVYKAKLHGQTDYVAVKVFDMETRGANRSFIAECEALRSVRHRNLVPILTACSSIDSGGNDFKALVYEFMTNGSLDSVLHPKEDGTHGPCYLTLTQRLSIALDVANALEYLHHSSQRHIVHSDLKPSNILLSNDMTAHISDFGLARFFDDVSAAGTSVVKGTIGYIAPEYAGGGKVMASGDVYAFGIILLEMFAGRRPTDDMFKDGMSIVSFVEASFPDHMTDIVNAQLLEEIDDFEAQKESTVTAMECVQSVLRVGLSCTCHPPSERMSTREVAMKLRAIRESYDADEARQMGC
ncbi:putative LRR receptor-like serine/threonine-protein kinase [Dichanthelium oligosanthes]|uniref:Receptor kinase-like protein Xa21 n=1 Tax=Dichanthelium oligosanthes TaxID=888268 RepID=A0A1E5UP50_9POAL|nr:putative LRR receptor-like serine/threonine-protein kinase [Dichanthelium oligosanthes]